MAHTSRLVSIDCFRGFAVSAKVLASYIFSTKDLPAWLRHASEGTLVSTTPVTAKSVSGSRFLLGGAT